MNVVSRDKNVLVVLQSSLTTEMQDLVDRFCGTVTNSFTEVEGDKKVYVFGDISTVKSSSAFIIKEFSFNYENSSSPVITLGEVPIVVSNAGVYFRKLFTDNDYFNKIVAAHEFQELTESNKESKAFRKGIYLTNITKDDKNVLHYRLLRCSSNLTGPTDNFRATDHKIIDTLNEAVKYVFEHKVELNHVLAQIYINKGKSADNEKEVKARIKAHSDKTKDMPQEGLIVFCTFYDNADMENLQPSATDRYDRVHKDVTGFTKLHFKLKSSVTDETLEKEFSVTLYPNSVFMIPLSTNRLYTHEIRPSMLHADKIPTRMGYVVRCSNVEAQYIDNQAYIIENGQLIQLEPMTSESQEDLRTTYREENRSEEVIVYGKVHFSMNEGDYAKPIL